jgi:hypothetical protein
MATTEVSIYAMYPSRQGLPLTVRMLVDHLMANLEGFLRSRKSDGLQIHGSTLKKSGSVMA